MKQIVSRLAGFTGSLLLLVACATPQAAAPASGGSSAAAPAASSNTLTAVKVDAVSTDAGAAYWGTAPVLTVHTKASEKGKPDGADVNLQAAYDGQNLAMRLEWADPTHSVINKPWTYDGSKFARTKELGDRFGLMFPIENNPTFASKGCAGACHNSDADVEKWWMGSDSADLRYDLWQWTAASTNPVGQFNDEWINVQTDPANAESATHTDKLDSGGSLSNVNEAKDGPAYMSGKDIAASIIISGEQVPIDASKLSAGAIIPASILAPWVGSRGDIQVNGTWKDGKWVLVLTRALDTGHDDDVVLTPPKPYPFGVAVFDQAEHFGHTTAPDVLTLEWK
ncbi:MAG: ethylbenzene dehydrogenase-related protein [Caldilineaceae bacterium]